jgi:cytochrome o ubiquinol oxidase subunit IV
MNTSTQTQGYTKTKLYALGFVISVICTLIPYVTVSHQLMSLHATYIVIVLFAFIQAIVQVFCFVRSNTSREDGRWNVIAFLFTIVIMVILVGGSLWIMYNLNAHMGH